MALASPEEVTGLLLAWRNGDQAALEKLIPLVYAELHRLAKGYMRRENEGHTLQTSALVNEAYLRLIGVHSVRWQNRSHFFAVSAQIMRRILVDFARAKTEPQERRRRTPGFARRRPGSLAGTRRRPAGAGRGFGATCSAQRPTESGSGVTLLRRLE